MHPTSHDSLVESTNQFPNFHHTININKQEHRLVTPGGGQPHVSNREQGLKLKPYPKSV